MNLSSIITAEKVIKDELRKDPTVDIFPVTLIKYLLNKNKITDFFEKVEQTEDITTLPSFIDFDSRLCDGCIHNSRGMLCRKHTSINRIVNNKLFDIMENQACVDSDTGIILYMNEMFKFVDNKLTIVYAPHTKLIQGGLTEHKIKKISSLSTIYDDLGDLFESIKYSNFTSFSSSELSNLFIKYWFNDEFSLITIPNNDDIRFCLIPNK